MGKRSNENDWIQKKAIESSMISIYFQMIKGILSPSFQSYQIPANAHVGNSGPGSVEKIVNSETNNDKW